MSQLPIRVLELEGSLEVTKVRYLSSIPLTQEISQAMTVLVAWWVTLIAAFLEIDSSYNTGNISNTKYM